MKLLLISDYILYPIITAVYPGIFYLLGVTYMFNIIMTLLLLIPKISATSLGVKYLSTVIRSK